MSSPGNFFNHLFHRQKKTEKPATQLRHKETQKNPITDTFQPLPHRPADQLIQSTQTSRPRDLWQAAYDQLDKSQRHVLSINKKLIKPGTENNILGNSIDQVIQITKEEYEKYHQTADGNFHKASRKIINAALSFKDIIGAVAALDPTQHAASVWNIVSLGLTMAKSYSASREALFESSEYLAEILTYGAFIEKNFYENRNTVTSSCPVEEALIKLYKAILCYTAQIQKIHDASIGQKIFNTVTNNLQRSLTILQAVAEAEKIKLNQWISLDHYLRHEQDASNILHRINGLADSTNQLLAQSYLDKLSFAEGASFDSFINQHEDFCLPDTRTGLLDEVSMWARSKGSFIFWLNGMAGTGKSTIARTVARFFQEQGLLGATFFFKRGEADRGNSKRFISTVTKQLVNEYPELKKEVLHAVENNPEIMTKSLNIQFEKLFYQPLTKLQPHPTPTIIIVVDALDECDGESDSQLILHLLFKMQDIKSVHLRVFLTSRPEFPIRHGFNNHQDYRDLILHELPKPMIEHDIRVFLEYKLSKIQHDCSLPPNWPGNDKREELAQMAVPLFIFAATACRFIQEGKHPDRRLKKFLEFKGTGKGQMDTIYLPILYNFLGNDKEELQDLLRDFHTIVGAIILLSDPLSIQSLASLLELETQYISEVLQSLHSVLHIPSDHEAPVRILHLSFRDYLLATRSRFHINTQKTHENIALHCLRVMNVRLEDNICKLPSYGTQYKDVEPQIIDKYITADLKYACRYWVHHLEQSKGQIIDYNILSFLQKHFLHWLEVLALIGEISEAIVSIDILKLRICTQVGPELSDFLYDAGRFTRQNSYMAGIAPLQLYRAGLIFAPTNSIIKQIFYSKVKDQLAVKIAVESSWSPSLQTLEGHSSFVHSVAFAPDGRTLASGSDDNTVKLWDTATGIERRTLTGHSNSVFSVVVSPDGRTLASGSGDDTIKLWNTATGIEQHTLTGHSSSVSSVAFSPDGRTLASGSHDNTVKLWNTVAGVEQRTLTGHSNLVFSVVFSPNGRILASGSWDNTIKLWNIATGVEQHTLTGYSELIFSVAFSPDGRTLASGSDDNTVKLWDTDTGIEKCTLTGHSNLIRSVAFSPNSRMVASGSEDNTVKLWDTDTGVEQGTLTGHSDFIRSVAFSPDGCMLVSGSNDSTVKLWDITAGAEQRTLIGHSDWVRSMAFSQDGCILASGSDDNTVKLWDTATGAEQRTLTGHSSLVFSVAFSLDGRTLASGSGDNTIKLWNTATGVKQHTLTGHSNFIRSVAFSPDSRTLASGSDDNTIKIWNTATGIEQRTLTGHSSSVFSVVFSPDGYILASSSGDNTIKLWNTATGIEQRILTGHSNLIRSVVFSPDSRMLASGSDDNTVKLWNTTAGVEQRTLTGHSKLVTSVAFSPDGRTLVSGSWDDTIKLWDTATGVEQRTLTGHSSSVNSMLNQSSTSYSISVTDSWVFLRGDRALWLPAEYRPFRCFAVKDTVLSLGLANGRVTIIGFDIL
ncbi:hypothetical protein ASPACDRAFT_121692 [Aspergillus aculeatus ATCC 16872]|uniref:Nephrocystin 3-like N-terminal domain-containing protein n=1 Tax=Aspergillus aculeatus (strain ATCC 16872 / CBS 172.66 / WB 5094) TaxID=690307 RepID=A0A1L9WRZ1_ASPA1|nr:uncharacterized protein ASPACDRAFT_121692 [Aspergillus aculeatus ATCC 16872]OJJ98902.1 hypothetical protein ASPACDRAFT_121692 [Aspergillus aculeatus ATCC 16872]